jgi:hypothetical protein
MSRSCLTRSCGATSCAKATGMTAPEVVAIPAGVRPPVRKQRCKSRRRTRSSAHIEVAIEQPSPGGRVIDCLPLSHSAKASVSKPRRPAPPRDEFEASAPPAATHPHWHGNAVVRVRPDATLAGRPRQASGIRPSARLLLRAMRLRRVCLARARSCAGSWLAFSSFCGMNGDAPFTVEQARAAGEPIGIEWATSPFDVERFRMGLEVEFEHGTRDVETSVTDDGLTVTAKIARAHLNESPTTDAGRCGACAHSAATWLALRSRVRCARPAPTGRFARRRP